jgi:hypothetical protein
MKALAISFGQKAGNYSPLAPLYLVERENAKTEYHE